MRYPKQQDPQKIRTHVRYSYFAAFPDMKPEFFYARLQSETLYINPSFPLQNPDSIRSLRIPKAPCA